MAVAARVVIASPTDTAVQSTGLLVLTMIPALDRMVVTLGVPDPVRDNSPKLSCTLGIGILTVAHSFTISSSGAGVYKFWALP